MADNHPDDWVDVAHDGHPDDWEDAPVSAAPEQGVLQTVADQLTHGGLVNSGADEGPAATQGVGTMLSGLVHGHGLSGSYQEGKAARDAVLSARDARLAQGQKDNPVVGGLANVAGALADPSSLAISGTLGKAPALLGKVPLVGKALAGTAKVGLAAAPVGLGAAGTLQGLDEEDPYKKTQLLAGSVPLLAAGGLGAMSKLGAAAMSGPAATARSGVLDGLVDEALPKVQERFKTLQSETSKVPDYRGSAESALKKQNRTDLASLKLEDRTAANGLKADFKAKQGNVSEVPDRFSEARRALEAQIGEQNDAAIKKLKTDAAWTKDLGTSPVGGPRAPSTPGAEPQWTDPAAKMNKEIQDSYALARAHKELGLNLTPEAQQGLANLTPDYEARINAELAKYSGGKANRLQEFRDILEGRAPNPEAPPRAPPKAPQLPFKLKDASDTRAAFDLKPNPLGGFTPAQAPPLKTPANFGVRAVEQGALKPNPLAGFAPKASGFTPRELPPLRTPDQIVGSPVLPPEVMESLQGLDPKPTAASVRPSLEGQVDPKIEQMRSEKGVLRRIGGGAVKGLMTPVNAGIQSGAMLTGNTGYMAPAAAGFGTMGALKTMATDPVVATALSRYSQSGGKNLSAIANFLVGAQGPVLAKKLQFLKQNDPEFAAAVDGGTK